MAGEDHIDTHLSAKATLPLGVFIHVEAEGILGAEVHVRHWRRGGVVTGIRVGLAQAHPKEAVVYFGFRWVFAMCCQPKLLRKLQDS